MTTNKTLLHTQQVAINEITTWLTKTKKQFFKLMGGAGSGKSTTTVLGIHPLLKSLGYDDIVFLTTTHQANNSLRQCFTDLKQEVPPIETIHSFLKIYPSKVRNKNTPEKFKNYSIQYSSKTKKYINRNAQKSIIVIDEAFRIDYELYNVILELLGSYRILFIGDPYQTLPVGCSSSPITTLEALEYTLKESPRFVNASTLNSLVTSFKKCVETNDSQYASIIPTEGSSDIVLNSIGLLKNKILQSIYNNNSIDITDLLILSGTNKIADSYNVAIENLRIQNNKNPVFEKDSINCFALYTPRYSEFMYNVNKITKCPTRCYNRIFHEDSLRINIGGKFFNYTKVNIKGSSVFFVYVPAKDIAWINANYKNCVNVAEHFKSPIILFSLSIAKTIHKVQGITSKEVFIDLTSIFSWSNHDMRRRLLYTGVSRASHTLYLMGK